MSSAAVQQSGPPQQYQQQRFASDPPNLPPSSPASRRTGRNSTDAAAYATSNSPAMMTPPRGHRDDLAASTYERYYPDSTGARGQHTALPIRTSAPQSTQSPTAASYDTRPHTSRAAYDGAGYSSQEDRDRRRSHRSPQDSPAQPGSNRSQRTRQVPAQSRSQTAVGQTPVNTELPRENSTVINRIVVDDPSADVARENARIAEARPHPMGTDVTPVGSLGLVGESGVPDSGRSSGQRSRQEHLKGSSHRKEVKFGDYILGQTLGEGEFGKVKMGWKKNGGVQVAIKLIRKESLAGNSTRLPKIYREISILKELQHPNIVRLHEFVETERHMGIILEYASGGELFDYILNHRYLKDPAARRLFAQLVSGVGYLHKKGIVHRDLKLENLLLDRHKNIIITDFGFANTFNPKDDLNEEQEHRISDKDYVKREGLDMQNKEGFRRGDLMQTSCGSPCYAAPELVVSDGLYTGRKVDVWSCGVILYAMLAGYLPFDDDPANPEGDNINLLYKYIVSTPLTFPEYVTPHARDLLRRILVPDPRRRADLFEVARHSWLSEYSHVVGFIGSNNKDEQDIAASAVSQDMEPTLGRSASVREPQNRTPSASAATPKQPTLDSVEERKSQRDAKRRTVQVEYVPPNATHARGETSPIPPQQATVPIAGTGRTRARPEAQGPVEVVPSAQRPQVPRKEVGSQAMPPPSRSGRDQGRAVSETAFGSQPTSAARPNTRGTLASRGNSYSQPAVATPTAETAQGHFSRPKSGSGYIISGSMPPPSSAPGSAPTPADSLNGSQQNISQMQPTQQLPQPHQRGHKRSSTLGSITDRVLGRSNSRRQSQQAHEGGAPVEKKDRRHPPVSMKNAMAGHDESGRRPSTDSRRSSFQFLRKNSEGPAESRRNSRRFSFLPSNFSMNNFSGKREPYDSVADSGRRGESRGGRPSSKGMAFGRGASRSPSRSTHSAVPHYYDADREAQKAANRRSWVSQDKALPHIPQKTPPPVQRKQYRDDGYGGSMQQEPVERYHTPNTEIGPPSTASDVQPHFPMSRSPYPPSVSQPQQQQYRDDGYTQKSLVSGHDSESQTSHIRPNQRKFGDAYEKGHDGSSSGARRVMDFFRRRGRERGGD